MKKKIKLVSVFIFLLMLVSFVTFHSEASEKMAFETNFGKLESPRSLYLNNCARCHGADGKSETEQGRQNETPNISGGKVSGWSAKKLTRIITSGEDKMPAFGKRLTKAQITSLVKYVRTL